MGTCMAAYTPSWARTNTLSCPGVMRKRLAASSPATPSEVRLNTAAM